MLPKQVLADARALCSNNKLVSNNRDVKLGFLTVAQINTMLTNEQVPCDRRIRLLKHFRNKQSWSCFHNKQSKHLVHWAFYKNKSRIVKLALLKGFFALGELHQCMFNPFGLLYEQGNRKLFKLFVQHGMDLRTIRSWQNQALEVTCKRGDLKFVKLLIRHGLTADDIRCNNNCALLKASTNHHFDVARYLIHKGKLHTNDICSVVNQIVDNDEKGRLKVVAFLFHNYLTIHDVRAYQHHQILHTACGNGFFDIVQFLIQCGIDVDDIRKYDYYAIRQAIKSGNVNIVAILVQQGLTSEEIQLNYCTIVKKAIKLGHQHIVDFLDNFIDEKKNVETKIDLTHFIFCCEQRKQPVLKCCRYKFLLMRAYIVKPYLLLSVI